MSVCVSCKDPLVLGTDEDEMEDGDNAPVPDDLSLPCGCHFHWQCFLDSASDVAITLKCPSCGSYLPTNQAGGPSVTNPVFPASQEVVIVTRYESEGGVQENYNILPDVTEEAYLLTHPEFRPAHAFHSMCAEGNAEELLAIIADVDSSPDDDDEAGAGASLTVNQLLRYQDPLDSMKSPLHIAIEKNQAQVALLLLYMASGLPVDSFPGDALEVAKGLGLRRPTLAGPEDDIRALKDANGHTAEEYAYKAGGPWIQFIEAGMFA
ncbi:hypothetical protein MAPG_02724 [Magnaporthiopsis poae ATCC 64411]|uniref:Uncharacterized protein n=1 Tax=Magnaporthiopsis poae (strain ATCC 64411 / 73-15) TaxID=644358 RepID=A0A0C4CSC5_MAGP6|nr:hypothetical protein, variant [Magnaporthiopsis poae ATCC 64411]KLU83673.1 hypothetical protein MAPG_02724 [Magnaporthiopsis poae ATCC 64411]